MLIILSRHRERMSSGGGGGASYEAPKCCGISLSKLNQFPDYPTKEAHLKKELVLSAVFVVAMAVLVVYLVIANSLSSILQSVTVSSPSQADIIRILGEEQDANCPCSNTQFTVGEYARFSYNPNPFCAFGNSAQSNILYDLIVDGSPLLNTVYASLLTLCNFGQSSLDTSLATLRGSYLTGVSALTQSRLEREVFNLVQLAQTTGTKNAQQVLNAGLFPPILEGTTSEWSTVVWPLIESRNGVRCSDFSSAAEIRSAAEGWQTLITVNITNNATADRYRGNLTVSCTAMSTAAEYATAEQLAVCLVWFVLFGF